MKKLFTDDLAQAIKESGQKKYRPSNGTEGGMFMDLWCNQCVKYSDDPDDLDSCDIHVLSFWLDIDDPKYPKEWTYDEGQPCCTEFEERK